MGIAVLSEKIIIAAIIIIIIIFDDFFREKIIEYHIYGRPYMGRNGLSIFSFVFVSCPYMTTQNLSPLPDFFQLFTSKKNDNFRKKMMIFECSYKGRRTKIITKKILPIDVIFNYFFSGKIVKNYDNYNNCSDYNFF